MKSRNLLAMTAGILFLLVFSSASSFAEVAIIVNKQNPATDITKKTLSNIFKQKQKTWEQGGTIEVVNLPKDNPLMEKFSESVLEMSSADLEKYYLKNALSGKGQPPRTAQSPGEVKSIVSGNKNAIGVIDSKDADPSVKVLAVGGN